MKFVEYSVKNPVVICVGVIFLLLFGYLAIKQMPYSLTPNISRPTVSIITTWSGATPYEMEKEITQRQEKFLKNLPNLITMTSTSREGVTVVNLEFEIDTDMKKALLDVNSKLSEVRGYPSNIDNPVVKATGESIAPVVYLFIKSKTKQSVKQFYTYINEDIVKLYERLEGVGMVDIVGGVAKQVQVILNTKQLAFYHITIEDVITALQNHNIDVSAGSLDYGQRAYRVRTIGLYKDVNDVYNTIVKTSDTQVVYLRDIASVIDTYELPTIPNTHNNDETISLQVRPTANANVLELIERVRELTDKLNNNQMKENNLHIDWGRDSAGFIQDAIALVQHDIALGIILAALVLYAFLRSFSSVFVITVIIPISILSSFILLNLMDRSLNVILLAGVSFAVSMIIDSSIVVVENIHRHYGMGKRMFESCIEGTKEVLGALFASTVTTVAIFIPIIGLKDEIGQLFSDIALASSSALIISLLICIVVVPSLYYSLTKFLHTTHKTKVQELDSRIHFIQFIDNIKRILTHKLLQKFLSKNLINKIMHPKVILDTFLFTIGQFLYRIITCLVKFCLENVWRRIACVVIFVAFSVFTSLALFPKLDYLPKGSQNFLIAYVQAPNGLSYQERLNILQEIYAHHAPYMSSNGFIGDSQYPAIKDFYISAGTTSIYFYAISYDSERVKELIPLMRESIDSIPNISGTVVEQGIFSSSGISENVEVNIIGFDIESMIESATLFMQLAKQYLPGARIRAFPSLDLGNREINLFPDMRSLAINGLDVKSFGNIVDVVVDGKKIGDFRNDEGRIIDLVLQTDNMTQSPEDILYSQIYAPSGKIMPLSSLADIRQDMGLSQIRHFEQNRNILFYINPEPSMPLQEVIEMIENTIKPQMESQNALKDNKMILSGNANKLYKLATHLSSGFILALVITYLLLTALYSNFLYPIIIIFTVPFALAGGFIGLAFVNTFIAHQNLDVLTMLGFIILVGSVVNNAILIVYQSLIHLHKYQMSIYNSVYEATISRIRPIYMSMLTSLLALAPLVFSSGAGSEIYRGLGAVICGGIFVSTIISIFVIPSLLMFVLKPPDKVIV
ncbi:efflux RND transporter permease subunit [Helicobacter sp. MIT 14-3879]|uniref:efflux RND transporter permease subunit n=1 Tax=Helicobacter sp. MIT 14-3879 TaxID=2040649 RepID=UPI000E1E9570|nr:efflux RND transporter permease subunit [Helicobacter sp. MIT 14-3879]RDU61329.1 AcrB/AcrD/AcrF family protein [Helicobacter sp. MIT 14-3879]